MCQLHAAKQVGNDGQQLGRFATLLDVVNHYNEFKKLRLSEQEKNDLVEFLKSL